MKVARMVLKGESGSNAADLLNLMIFDSYETILNSFYNLLYESSDKLIVPVTLPAISPTSLPLFIKPLA